VDAELLAQELRIGCTLAMLLCLDPGHRMAYILGVIMGLDHRTGAEVLDISPAAFRKRLQRARDGVEGLMAKRCGLFDPANPCRCHKRIPIAMELGPDRSPRARAGDERRAGPPLPARARGDPPARPRRARRRALQSPPRGPPEG
jgi:hypothetical protein